MATLAQIKTWWSQVLRPTVEQRNETWDSIRLKSDAIAISDIQGLNDALNAKGAATKRVLAAGTAYWDVPAGTILTGLWFQAGTACSIGVGYSTSDANLFDASDLATNGDLLIETFKPFRANTRIYFNGIAADTITIIYFL